MVVAPRNTPASLAAQRSAYLKYLPGIYSESDFMGRFLMIFESVMRPIEAMVDNIAYYFDPDTAPEELLPWLASWVNLVLDESWPIERRRRLVKSAVQLFQWRGTRRGLREYLRVYAGVEPKIVEESGGTPLCKEARLGWNTVLGSKTHHSFTVLLEVEDPSSLNIAHLKAIIEAEKPAHAGYRLKVVEKPRS
ncbi:MAG: phage tail protein I [Chloroflexi bacterium]|nr:phage tail protein I [Chloroflexota bacterium]